MRTARFADHSLSPHRLQVFKDALKEMNVELVVKESPHLPNAVRLTNVQISFDPNRGFMTKEEREIFDEDAHWNKNVIAFCKEFGFELIE
jgi:hypothetical protein